MQELRAKGRATEQEGTTLYTARVRMSGVVVECALIRYTDGEIDIEGNGQQIEKVYRSSPILSLLNLDAEWADSELANFV